MIRNSQTLSPRHLSFSATLQREDGKILLVRRPIFDSRDEITATQWSSADNNSTSAHPSYLVQSANQPRETSPFELKWTEPRTEGERALRNPEEYSHLFHTHATFLPYFGGHSDTLDTITQLQGRATG